MTPAPTLDLRHLPPFEISNKAPLWWGQLLVCVIEGAMFATLIAMYFYLRMSVDVWPPPGTNPLDPLLPSLALIPLLASTVGSYLASEAAKKDDRTGILIGLGLNLLLAIVFLILRWVEWRSFTFNWRADVHGAIVWSILFIHTFDVVADLVFTLVLLVFFLAGMHGARQRISVHVDSVVWYFLVGIWLPLYAVIYWAPHLIGTK
jgi:cytochrome c oxidase subunit I+III